MIENKNIEEVLVDNNIKRDSYFYEDELNNYITEHEGAKIKDDIKILEEMGYEKKMINKVYILLQPQNIERAVDYMTEIDGVYQHDFFENHDNNNKDLCFICQKTREFHLDYIPEELLVNDNINNNQYNLLENNNIIQFNNNNNDNNIEDDFSFDFDDFSDEDYKDENKNDKNVTKNNDDIVKGVIRNECSVCFEEIKEEEKKSNSLPCGHICCQNCWTNYFKTLITDAKVEEIKCVEHDCKQIIQEEFILKYIKNDKKLISKYKKFKLRIEIIKDPNKKQCPKPDCESYLEKSPDTKYVKCKKGHKFCFECLRAPHGQSSCEQLMEKDFLKWKKNRILKKCPRCHIYTEKNEGCNHMTCSSCKYQWCWLCLGQYKYGHYDRGECKGHQFTKADNLEEAKKGKRRKRYYYGEQNQHLCCFTIFNIFPWFYHGHNRPFELFNLRERYIAIFVMWFFGYFLFAGLSMLNYTEDRIDLKKVELFYYIIGALMTLCLFICFQILFTCLITPFILVSLVYPYFIDNILIFLDMNL